jgi:tetratricopeptide (TPR) repeat protein
MYLELDRVDDALAMLQASQEHLKADAVGSLMKNQEALCLLALGRLDEAAAACREALAHSTCSERVRAEATFTQARLAEAVGRDQECNTLSNQALDVAIHLPHPRLCRKITVFLTSVQNRGEVPKS